MTQGGFLLIICKRPHPVYMGGGVIQFKRLNYAKIKGKP